MSMGQLIADNVTKFVGSWRFIFIFSAVLGIWVILNTVAYFEIIQFDPYPYILMNLVLSSVAAIQAPFIMMSQNRAEIKQDIAYRGLFEEIKELVHCSIEIEEKMMEMIRIDHEDEVKYRIELSELTKTIKEMVEIDHKDAVKYRIEIAELTTAIKEMVEIDHSDEVQYKKEISQLVREMQEVKTLLTSIRDAQL
jgi:uncharacterized membrane protein